MAGPGSAMGVVVGKFTRVGSDVKENHEELALPDGDDCLLALRVVTRNLNRFLQSAKDDPIAGGGVRHRALCPVPNSQEFGCVTTVDPEAVLTCVGYLLGCAEGGGNCINRCVSRFVKCVSIAFKSDRRAAAESSSREIGSFGNIATAANRSEKLG